MSTVFQDVVYTSVIEIFIYRIFSSPRSPFLDGKEERIFHLTYSIYHVTMSGYFFPAVLILSTPPENSISWLYLLKVSHSFSIDPGLVVEEGLPD